MKSNITNLGNLVELGKIIQLRRKALEVRSQIAADTAYISRGTLRRIEKGEPSVSIGSYLKVCKVLGIELITLETNTRTDQLNQCSTLLGFDPHRLDEEQIVIQHYPQLKELVWQLRDDAMVFPRDALNIYERNWRFLDLSTMTQQEKYLIEQLKNQVGNGFLLV